MFRVALIADVHLGVIDVERQKKELETIFFHDLKNLSQLDMIVVLGDVYDKKIYLNDTTTDIAIWFFRKLIETARMKNAIVRLIYGTKSHEADQYNLLEQVPQDGVDLQVIRHAKKEKIMDGVNVLYLPEEHIYSKQEYYKELLTEWDEPYQYIFGHGIIDEIMKSDRSMTEEKKETKRLHVPRFTIGDFKDCCDGCVFFGHYHVHSEYKDFVYYVGSYNRWKFGEEEPKGYMLSEHVIGSKEYLNTFIENGLTDRYHTIFYGHDHKIFQSENQLIEEFERLEKLITDGIFEKIRCMVNFPETLENPDFYVNAFRERFRFSEDIKVEFGNGQVERARVVDKEKAKQVHEEYGYLQNQSTDIEVITSRFIQQENGIEISPERIKKYKDATSISDLL